MFLSGSLKVENLKQQKLIREHSMEKNKGTDEKKDKQTNKQLPKMYQVISFKLDGKRDFLQGKVVKKHKPNSLNRNIVVLQFDDDSIEEFYFHKDVVEWYYTQDATEDILYESFIKLRYCEKATNLKKVFHLF